MAPRLRNLTDGDANAAVGVLSAILFALRHRQRTGQGQFVSASMVGGNVMAYSDDFNRYAGKVAVRQSDPDQLGTGALHRLYEAQEGWIYLEVPTQQEWDRAVDALGRPVLAADPRYATPADRDAHDDELAADLAAVLATRPAAAWEALLTPLGVGCVVATAASQAETMVHDEHLRTMGLVTEIDHPRFGPLLRYGPPAALSATPARLAPGCVLAQHTAAILDELGYSTDDVAKLAEAGVVRLAG